MLQKRFQEVLVEYYFELQNRLKPDPGYEINYLC